MTENQEKALELADANSDLIQRLRRTPMPLADIIPHIQAMGDELRLLHAEAEEFNHEISIERMAREALQKDIEELKTVMIAAAEEIHEHWEAHCDAEGYGPANLMRRLEQGIPSEYGYTAGAFATLKSCVLEAQNAAIDLSGALTTSGNVNKGLLEEIERLNKAIKYEQHRADRIGTHGPGCEMWGPQHYECSIRKLKEQQDSMERVLKARDRYGWSVEADVEIEAMRDQLDKKS